MTNKNGNTYNFDTIALHEGHTVDVTTRSRAVPLYQTTSYVFDSTEHAADLFKMNGEGYIYSRNANPTLDVFEKRLASLEGWSRCVCGSFWTGGHCSCPVNARKSRR